MLLSYWSKIQRYKLLVKLRKWNAFDFAFGNLRCKVTRCELLCDTLQVHKCNIVTKCMMTQLYLKVHQHNLTLKLKKAILWSLSRNHRVQRAKCDLATGTGRYGAWSGIQERSIRFHLDFNSFKVLPHKNTSATMPVLTNSIMFL